MYKNTSTIETFVLNYSTQMSVFYLCSYITVSSSVLFRSGEVDASIVSPLQLSQSCHPLSLSLIASLSSPSFIPSCSIICNTISPCFPGSTSSPPFEYIFFLLSLLWNFLLFTLRHNCNILSCIFKKISATFTFPLITSVFFIESC